MEKYTLDNQNYHLSFDPYLKYEYVGTFKDGKLRSFFGDKEIELTDNVSNDFLLLMQEKYVLISYFWNYGVLAQRFGYFILDEFNRPVYTTLLWMS